jgi:NADH dehydrogenase FAD-containing subunit
MSQQTILILGGGVGGVVAANRLRKRLDRRHRVVLGDREPSFTLAASFLWVMTGDRRPEQISRPLAMGKPATGPVTSTRSHGRPCGCDAQAGSGTRGRSSSRSR